MLDNNPHNISLQQTVSHIKNKLHKIETYKGKGAQLRAHLQWMKGDKSTTLIQMMVHHRLIKIL